MTFPVIQAPALVPRLSLWWSGEVVGSLTPEVGDMLCLALSDNSGMGLKKMQLNNQWIYVLESCFIGNFTQALQYLAQTLRTCGRSGPWRNELLPVTNASGRVLGLVERGVVRVLGLRTQAVHLVGLRPDGAVWVQQRSLAKPNDPGLWDTLMGGTVAGSETVADTLERETWEEAGLRLADLADVVHQGHFIATRPVPDGGGAGYLVENTHWYTATVPAAREPLNQDGEVDHFECWSPEQVRQAVAEGLFTPEAAWVLIQTVLP